MKNGPLRRGVSHCAATKKLRRCSSGPTIGDSTPASRVFHAVETHRLANRVRAAAEAFLPELMAHDHCRRAARTSVRLGERRTYRRLDPEQREIGPRHHAASDSFCDRAVAERHLTARVAGDLLEMCLFFLQGEVVGDREREPVGWRIRVDPHDSCGIGVGKRAAAAPRRSPRKSPSSPRCPDRPSRRSWPSAAVRARACAPRRGRSCTRSCTSDRECMERPPRVTRLVGRLDVSEGQRLVASVRALPIGELTSSLWSISTHPGSLDPTGRLGVIPGMNRASRAVSHPDAENVEVVIIMSTIGLIGAGHIGSQVARLAVKNGHNVVISNSRGPETLAELVSELGPKARAGTPLDAAGRETSSSSPSRSRTTSPFPSSRWSGKIVIDTNNYYPQRDGHIPELDNESTTTSGSCRLTCRSRRS